MITSYQGENANTDNVLEIPLQLRREMPTQSAEPEPPDYEPICTQDESDFAINGCYDGRTPSLYKALWYRRGPTAISVVDNAVEVAIMKEGAARQVARFGFKSIPEIPWEFDPCGGGVWAPYAHGFIDSSYFTSAPPDVPPATLVSSKFSPSTVSACGGNIYRFRDQTHPEAVAYRGFPSLLGSIYGAVDYYKEWTLSNGKVYRQVCDADFVVGDYANPPYNQAPVVSRPDSFYIVTSTGIVPFTYADRLGNTASIEWKHNMTGEGWYFDNPTSWNANFIIDSMPSSSEYVTIWVRINGIWSLSFPMVIYVQV